MGMKVSPSSAIMKKAKVVKLINSLRKGLRTSASARTSRSKAISCVWSNGPTTLGCSTKGTSISDSKHFLPFISSLRPWIHKELPSCRYRPEAKQKQRLLRIKLQAKGKCQLRDHLSFEQVNTDTTLVEKRKAQLVVIARDVDPNELVSFLPALSGKIALPYFIMEGKASLGWMVHRKTSITALAKLVEAGRIDDYRHGKVFRHWGGNVLAPKSVAHNAKLEKANNK